MKLSISLPDEDVARLDEYARSVGLASRSAAVRRAINLLRNENLEDDYAAAWDEWDTSGGRAAWAGVVADGLSDAPR